MNQPREPKPPSSQVPWAILPAEERSRGGSAVAARARPHARRSARGWRPAGAWRRAGEAPPLPGGGSSTPYSVAPATRPRDAPGHRYLPHQRRPQRSPLRRYRLCPRHGLAALAREAGQPGRARPRRNDGFITRRQRSARRLLAAPPPATCRTRTLLAKPPQALQARGVSTVSCGKRCAQSADAIATAQQRRLGGRCHRSSIASTGWPLPPPPGAHRPAQHPWLKQTAGRAHRLARRLLDCAPARSAARNPNAHPDLGPWPERVEQPAATAEAPPQPDPPGRDIRSTGTTGCVDQVEGKAEARQATAHRDPQRCSTLADITASGSRRRPDVPSSRPEQHVRCRISTRA